MKFKSFLILFLIAKSAWSFDSDFKIISDRVPLEFEMMFQSLKVEAKLPSEQLNVIAITKDLNENLKYLEKEHIFLLLKTEVIKGVLEHKFKLPRPIEVNDSLIARLEREQINKQENLSRFSKWIFQSTIAELKHRQALGLITSAYFNPATFGDAKRGEAIRFKKYLVYMTPWMEKMMSLSPLEFNQLSKSVSIEILRRVNSRTQLFKQFAKTAQTTTAVTIFNIPPKYAEMGADTIKRMQNDQPTELTLKEQSKKEKLEAAETIERVTPLDMSPLSDDVAKELEATEKKESPIVP